MTVEATRQARSCSPEWQQAGEHRDERRGDGARGDQLEDEVRDAERGEVGVELGAGAEQVADDDEAHPAEDARGQEGADDDDARARQRAASRSRVLAARLERSDARVRGAIARCGGGLG